MRKTLQGLSIKTKLVITIFISIMLVVLTGFVLVAYQQTQYIRQNIVDESKIAINILAQDFARIVLLNSPDVGADTVSRIAAFPSILNVTLYSLDGQELFQYAKENRQSATVANIESENVSFTDDELRMFVPAMYEKQRFGTVFFRISMMKANQRIKEIYRLILMLIPFFMLMSFILALTFQKFFTNPILALTRFIHKVSRFNDYSLRIQDVKKDEVGQVASGFNHLLDNIQKTNYDLQTQTMRLHSTLDSISESVIATDSKGYIQYMNPVAERLLGIRDDEKLGEQFHKAFNIVCEMDRHPIKDTVVTCISSGLERMFLEDILLLAGEENEYAITLNATPLYDENRDIIGAVVVIHNVTQSRALTRQLTYQATHDALTDLPNRTYIETRIKQILQMPERNLSHALMYLDLDQFKVVNDTCGHIAGDELLKQLAHLFKLHIRGKDIVSRVGGDEFVIFLEDCPREKARKIAQLILRDVSDMQFVWGEKWFTVGVSIGLVPISDSSMSYNDIMSAADVACYTAKDLGRNRMHEYQLNDSEYATRRDEMEWVHLINQAFEQGRYVLYMQDIQPTVGMEGARPHYELLVRMRASDDSIVPPGSFLSAAERYDLSQRIDYWVIETALELIATLNKTHKSEEIPYFSINLSGKTLSNGGFLDYVRGLLMQHPDMATYINFEVTETIAVSNLTETIHMMNSLKVMGFKFSLDDFGSGVSSYAYLKNLPVDFLKIDGSFVRNIAASEVDRVMVEAIQRIARVMDIKTVAEFVENKNILDVLAQLGVDYVQGYGIAKPQPVDALLGNGSLKSKLKVV
jgi:diguanylate cyclase (GGDEF)-like protein/PAS domain S-box-containing protein